MACSSFGAHSTPAQMLGEAYFGYELPSSRTRKKLATQARWNARKEARALRSECKEAGSGKTKGRL
jgi:hypothetical protein